MVDVHSATANMKNVTARRVKEWNGNQFGLVGKWSNRSRYEAVHYIDCSAPQNKSKHDVSELVESFQHTYPSINDKFAAFTDHLL